jgi:ABC-type Fe3+/spermidine/putrescine transport system ATPase subunit
VQTGKPKELFVKPRNRFVASFWVMRIFDAKVLEKLDSFYLVDAEGAELKVAESVDSSELTVAVRPEDVSISFS